MRRNSGQVALPTLSLVLVVALFGVTALTSLGLATENLVLGKTAAQPAVPSLASRMQAVTASSLGRAGHAIRRLAINGVDMVDGVVTTSGDVLRREVIQAHLSDDLLKSVYRTEDATRHPATGHCSVACEAAYHFAGGKESEWKPVRLRINPDDDGAHWWLQNKRTGEIFDPTYEQFEFVVDYAAGRGGGFMTPTGGPSIRATELMRRIQLGGYGTPTSELQLAYLPDKVFAAVDERGYISKFGLHLEHPLRAARRLGDEGALGGGYFVSIAPGEVGRVVNGRVFSSGIVDGVARRVQVPNDDISALSRGAGPLARVNLLAPAKWSAADPQSLSSSGFLVSLESTDRLGRQAGGKGSHLYAQRVRFDGPVEAQVNSHSKANPRGKMVGRGEPVVGREIGEISIQGKLHPLFDEIVVAPRAE